MRGLSDLPFIFATVVFIAVVVLFITTIESGETKFQDVQFLGGFDSTVFVGGVLGVASACVITSGLVCAGAIAISSIINIFSLTSSNSIISALIVIPILVGIGYILSKLARGGG